MTRKYATGDLVMYYPLDEIPTLAYAYWFMGVIKKYMEKEGVYVYYCDWFKVKTASNGNTIITPHKTSNAGTQDSHLRLLLTSSEVNFFVDSI